MKPMHSASAATSFDSEQSKEDIVPGEGRVRGLSVGSVYARLLAPTAGNFGAVLEAASVTVIALFIGWLFSPVDPLFLAAGFPYAWILPIVIAMRYGTLLGLFSSLIVVGGWFVLYSGIIFHAASVDSKSQLFPSTFFLGGFLLIFIVGQFGDIWAGRMARARAVNAYLADRLSTLTKNHFLLKISHERLENDLLMRPTTLRGALLQLRQLTLSVQDTTELLPGAAQLLQFVAHACQLESAALYAVRDDQLLVNPVAEVGTGFTLMPADPLLQACLDTKVLTHLQTASIREGLQSDYVVCVPLLSGAEDVIGVLVVKQMPFLSLTEENLQLLLMLAGYYADGARSLQSASKVLAEIPNCPQDFALDYVRLMRLEQEAGVSSTLTTLIFGPGEQQEMLCVSLRRGLRALDVSWRIEVGDKLCLLILMPLTGEDAVSAYLLRAERSLQQYDLDFAKAHITFRSMRIGGQIADGALKNFLSRIYADA